MRSWTALLLPIVVNAAVASIPTNCTAENAVSPKCSSNEALHRRDFFYIGGRYVYDATFQGNLLVDQMYVEKLTPASGIGQPYPLVFLHGGGISGVTPDNREGWASWFLDQGYAVYIVDETSVGRSTQEDLAGYPLRIGATAEIAQIGFTVPEKTNPYPQSQLHTQWPGSGVKGDPIFDAFFATFIPLTSNTTRLELSMRADGCDLLSRIGPSFLISHSFGAQFATLISDQCPDLIIGNINLEPSNYPFETFFGNAASSGRAPSRPYGLTATPITYDPPVASPGELQTVTVGEDTPALHSCKQQVDPARRLPNIAKVPYLALTGEASIHITTDQCIINYLKQCGVKPDWIKLADIGIRGNGHFMFLEKNNLQIAAVVNTWIKQHNGRDQQSMNGQ